MTALATVAPKLTALLPRLASDHEGEVVATVRALRRVLAGAGLDLHDLAAAVTHGPQPVTRSAPGDMPDLRDWRRTAAWCADRADWLSEGERRFVAQLAGGGWRRPSITPRQSEWLAAIVAKLHATEGA
jgi:hypothetical protein